jgi:23S rRNA G2069 N7-methylase RlmK/C1962 C5-methylase RlmI
MRVYDRNISEYPVTIDVYGNYVKIQEFGETASDSEVIVDAVSRMLYIPSKHIVYQVRKKRTGREQHSLL